MYLCSDIHKEMERKGGNDKLLQDLGQVCAYKIVEMRLHAVCIFLPQQ